jgi:ribosomal protein S18 acetylase RimI-like enzyme
VERCVNVEIIKADNKQTLREFVDLPYRLHRGHERWVPPIYSREKNYLSARRNKHMAHAETACFLARRDGETAGRIMTIINHNLSEVDTQKQARFCKFESVRDPAVARGLFEAAEQWSAARGMRKLVGPLGFSNQDSIGFLVEGFEERPCIDTNYNYSYIPELVEAQGYGKEVDYVTYKLPVPEEIPPLYTRLIQRLTRNNDIRVLEFKRKGPARAYLPRVLRFMNRTYGHIYGFVPLTETEIRSAALTYSRILSPPFFKVVLAGDNEIVSFVLGIRDLTEGIIRSKGRLFPFGLAIIKLAQKRADRVDLLIGAVKQSYRNRGLDALMSVLMIQSAKAEGIDHFDTHMQVENNVAAQAVVKRIGGFLYKRFRIYRKDL